MRDCETFRVVPCLLLQHTRGAQSAVAVGWITCARVAGPDAAHLPFVVRILSERRRGRKPPAIRFATDSISLPCWFAVHPTLPNQPTYVTQPIQSRLQSLGPRRHLSDLPSNSFTHLTSPNHSDRPCCHLDNVAAAREPHHGTALAAALRVEARPVQRRPRRRRGGRRRDPRGHLVRVNRGC